MAMATRPSSLPPCNIADLFASSPIEAWDAYMLLEWEDRVKVAHAAQNNNAAWAGYLEQYKSHVKDYFLDEFYDVLNSNVDEYADLYAKNNQIDVPLLKPTCLSALAEWSLTVEHKGHSRYGNPRTVYPPGEVKNWPSDDPRKSLKSDVNMTAVGQMQLLCDDPVQWIYHSPHLQLFVQRVMGFSAMYPYHNGLGVAVNIMRPMPGAQTSLGFHFDAIDSSAQVSAQSGNKNARGATGVIGIQDSIRGGERIVYPTLDRDCVQAVASVVRSYDPEHPHRSIDGHEPQVVTEPIAGVLSLFNGGDMLHGVSAVLDGIRVATVFLFCEQEPEQSQSNADSATAFYGK